MSRYFDSLGLSEGVGGGAGVELEKGVNIKLMRLLLGSTEIPLSGTYTLFDTIPLVCGLTFFIFV